MAAKSARLVDTTINTPEYEHDNVFFTKAQIKAGTLLQYHGRREPGSVWRVTAIHTYILTPRSLQWRVTPSTEVVKLSDIITLTRVGKDDYGVSMRRSTFGALSYSAIWRIKS